MYAFYRVCATETVFEDSLSPSVIGTSLTVIASAFFFSCFVLFARDRLDVARTCPYPSHGRAREHVCLCERRRLAPSYLLPTRLSLPRCGGINVTNFRSTPCNRTGRKLTSGRPAIIGKIRPLNLQPCSTIAHQLQWRSQPCALHYTFRF